MTETKAPTKTISMTNTKTEMLGAYKALLKQFQEKSQPQVSPETKAEKEKVKEIEQVVDSLSSETIAKEISNLKIDIGKMLGEVSERLENEVNKFRDIQKAIELKKKELEEVYEIENSSATLLALVEAQHQKRKEFESEIETTRLEWDKEKELYEAEVNERDVTETKTREREKEEYLYTLNREQQMAKDKFEDEKAKLEKEIKLKKEQAERELEEREKSVAEREEELNELRKKVSNFPNEMESAINKEIKDIAGKLQMEAKNKEELLRKDFNGERNVLTTQIKSFEQTVKQQSEQITSLSQQLEKAYQKIQDIAVKTVEGKSLSSLQGLLAEQTRKQSQ